VVESRLRRRELFEHEREHDLPDEPQYIVRSGDAELGKFLDCDAKSDDKQDDHALHDFDTPRSARLR
jgi:hypothetical protein